MKRFAGLVLILGLGGCASTLPSDESVIVTLSSLTVAAGEEVRGVLVNGSGETIGFGILPCTARIIDATSGEPITPPSECEQPLIGLHPGGRYGFTFVAPVVGGSYRFEIPLSAPDSDSPWGALDVRSAVFTVRGPQPASR
jgi:hypothetical protein